MKKIFALIMCLFIMIAVTACSNNTPDADNPAVTAAPAATDSVENVAVEETDEEPAASVEVALLDNYTYEEDGETRTFLALALKAPEKSSWSLRTKDGDIIDTWINS